MGNLDMWQQIDVNGWLMSLRINEADGGGGHGDLIFDEENVGDNEDVIYVMQWVPRRIGPTNGPHQGWFSFFSNFSNLM